MIKRMTDHTLHNFLTRYEKEQMNIVNTKGIIQARGQRLLKCKNCGNDDLDRVEFKITRHGTIDKAILECRCGYGSPEGDSLYDAITNWNNDCGLTDYEFLVEITEKFADDLDSI